MGGKSNRRFSEFLQGRYYGEWRSAFVWLLGVAFAVPLIGLVSMLPGSSGASSAADDADDAPYTQSDNADAPAERTATLVVAASSASASEIARSDYRCDGIDDQEEINAAITELAATGGEVHLSSGTFNISHSILLVSSHGYSYLTLSGCGANSVLATTTAEPLGDHFIKCSTTTSRYMYCTFKDFRIDGTNQTAGDGVHTFGATYSRYLHLSIRYCFDNGICLDADKTHTCVDQFVDGCIVCHCGGDGICLAPDATDVTISDCSIYYNAGKGIYARSGGCIIMGNRIYGNEGDGVYVNGWWTSINGNYFGGNYRAVVLAGNAHYSVVNNNIISRPNAERGTGVYVASGAIYSQVEGNEFDSNGTNVENHEATATVRGNVGWLTENHGTGTIADPATSVEIHHGLSAIPTVVNIVFTENPSNPVGNWWVSDIGADTFTVNVTNAPGSSDLDFQWEAKVV